MSNKISESEVLDGLMVLLIPQQIGGFFWRNNTGAVEIGDRFVRFGLKGAPDVMGCFRGSAVGFECKELGKKLSPDQKIWASRWVKCGGLYYVVDSETAAVDAINSMERGRLIPNQHLLWS